MAKLEAKRWVSIQLGSAVIGSRVAALLNKLDAAAAAMHIHQGTSADTRFLLVFTDAIDVPEMIM